MDPAFSSRPLSTSLRTLLSSSRFHRTPYYSSLFSRLTTLKTLTSPTVFRGTFVVDMKSRGFGWRMKATVANTRMATKKSEGKKVSVFDSKEDLVVAFMKYTVNQSDKVSKMRDSFTVNLWLSRHHHRRHSKDSKTWIFKHDE